MDIEIKELPFKEAKLVMDALRSAYASADVLPVMFCMHANDTEPTPGQKALSKEILSYCLNNYCIQEEDSSLVGEAFSWLVDELETMRDYSDPEYAKGSEEACDFVEWTFGIRPIKENLDIIQEYAELLKK